MGRGLAVAEQPRFPSFGRYRSCSSPCKRDRGRTTRLVPEIGARRGHELHEPTRSGRARGLFAAGWPPRVTASFIRCLFTWESQLGRYYAMMLTPVRQLLL